MVEELSQERKQKAGSYLKKIIQCHVYIIAYSQPTFSHLMGNREYKKSMSLAYGICTLFQTSECGPALCVNCPATR
jgi:hypothetical protein